MKELCKTAVMAVSMVVTCCYPESSTGNLKSPMVQLKGVYDITDPRNYCQLTFWFGSWPDWGIQARPQTSHKFKLEVGEMSHFAMKRSSPFLEQGQKPMWLTEEITVISSWDGSGTGITFSETKIAPANWQLEDYFPFEFAFFQCLFVSFWGCRYCFPPFFWEMVSGCFWVNEATNKQSMGNRYIRNVSVLRVFCEPQGVV